MATSPTSSSASSGASSAAAASTMATVFPMATAGSVIGFNLTTAAASLKLDSNNYQYWRIHIESLLEGSGLLAYIQNPSNEPPPTVKVTADAAPTPNPAHAHWRQQDRWIFHILFTSLTPTVASIVSGRDTAKQVWDKLYTQFGKPSRGRVRQLKRSYYDLQRLPNQSVSDFAYMVKAKHDELIQLGERLTNDDLNDLILSKLGDNYSELARALEVRDSAMDFEELIDRLITFQVPIASATPFGQASAFAAAVRPSYGSAPRSSSTFPTPWRSPPSQQVSPTSYPSQPPSNTSLHHPRPQHTTPNRPFVPPRPDAHGRPRKPYQGYCFLCQAQGHSAKFCPTHFVPISQLHSQLQTRPPRPQANVAVHQPFTSSPNWTLDSGSSHHVTSDFQNLSLHSPYAGTDGLVIGDGSPLPISHTGLPYSEPSPSWSS